MQYKKVKLISVVLAVVLLLSGCGAQPAQSEPEKDVSPANADDLAKIDKSQWQYNTEDDVYWQTGVAYCAAPVAAEYESLGIFVPGTYMTATENENSTFTCEIDFSGEISGYTAATAPIVLPVNTPGYSAMPAPTGYVSGAKRYTDAGFIYVEAGCRGRDAGAPAGVTDLKAAIRYLRYHGDELPGDAERIFSFGMSGGGAQSALLGATGDSPLYGPYLEAIGAAQNVSDAVAGAMCWCPITNLDYANEAYEWNFGVTRSDLDGETQELSDAMAQAFAEYINELGLKSPDGNMLVLAQSDTGIYQAGSYYDYIKVEIERSLNNFLSDTQFPYTSGGMGGMAGGPGRLPVGGPPDGEMPGMPEGEPQRREPGGRGPRETDGYMDQNGNFQEDGINRMDKGMERGESKTYETAQDYIDSLNTSGTWIVYDPANNTAAITSVADFMTHCKAASKSVGAFDDLNARQGENILFGFGDGAGAHFDPIMAELLSGTQYGADYAADLEKTDALGTSMQTRMNMYNPMYFLSDYYEGNQSAKVAEHWRIRTGIEQGDTALCTEVNLALALENYGVDVDFETVWEQGHTQAERTGSADENFIAWVNSCVKG
jgi:hypothetical protein